MRSSVKATTDPAIVQCKWCHCDWSGLVSQKCDGDKDARRVPCTSDVTQRDTCRTIIQGSVSRAPGAVVDTTCSMQNNAEYITTGCATHTLDPWHARDSFTSGDTHHTTTLVRDALPLRLSALSLGLLHVAAGTYAHADGGTRPS
jgi:hypothetical protein